MAMKSVDVLVEDETGDFRRVSKIIRMTQGDFAICVPRHNCGRGYLAKVSADPTMVGAQWVTTAGWETFSLDREAKLSVHLSGFVQFSGHGVRSGFCPGTRVVKGLGLKGDGPVRIQTGGPAVSICLWGLQDYPVAHPSDPARQSVFVADDYYFKGDNSETRDGFTVEFFLMKSDGVDGTRRSSGRGDIWVGPLPSTSPVFQRFELRIIELTDPSFFLGVLVSQIATSYASVSGFTIVSPSLWETEVDCRALMAMYPRPEGWRCDDSLDYDAV